MIREFDFNKEYGLVLEGGGAKGSYQIGVWKALKELGVKIKGVAGVSVGALNGALICMDDYEKAERLWNNITYSQIMDVNDEEMNKLMSGNLKKLKLNEFTQAASKFFLDRGFDVAPLKQLIEECIDEEKIQQSTIEFIMGTFSITQLKELVVTAKEAETEFLKDYLLASAYFPAFKNEKLHGVKYIDGGVVNNVPVDMLIERDYKDIIVIRIYGIGLEKKVKVPDDVNVIEVAPRINLGGILEFNKEKSARNIKIGYYDGLRLLKGLYGSIYYIETSSQEDEYYLNKFVRFNEAAKMALLEYYKVDYSNPKIYVRQLLENVCPSIALELKLDKGFTYKELYIAMLELCAKNLRILKYKLYLEEELLIIIKEKYENGMYKKSSSNLFIEIILKTITIKA